MRHNSVVSGHPKFTGIPQVDGLSTRPPDLGRHRSCRENFLIASYIEYHIQNLYNYEYCFNYF